MKVFVVEHQGSIRNSITSLKNNDEVTIVDEVKDEREALKKIADGIDAEVIISNAGGSSGSLVDGLLEAVKKSEKNTKVVLLSPIEEESYVYKALRAGAHGYLLDSITQDEMIFALRHVASGSKYICSELSLKILNNVSEPQFISSSAVELSKREMEVLALIAEGFTNHEIAGKLFTSRRTVEGHRQNLLNKTSTRNTAALIWHAVKNGLV